MKNDRIRSIIKQVFSMTNGIKVYSEGAGIQTFAEINPDVYEAEQVLLALVDRHPSEDELRAMRVALDQCYDAFDRDAPGFHEIRKALGIPE